MKFSVFKLTALSVFVAYALFFLLNIWFDNLIDAELFFKVTMTFVVVAGIMTVYYLLYHLNSEKELKDKNFIKD